MDDSPPITPITPIDVPSSFSALWLDTTHSELKYHQLKLLTSVQAFYAPTPPTNEISSKQLNRCRIFGAIEAEKFVKNGNYKGKELIRQLQAREDEGEWSSKERTDVSGRSGRNSLRNRLQEYQESPELYAELVETANKRRDESKLRAKSFDWPSPFQFREEMNKRAVNCHLRRNSLQTVQEAETYRNYVQRHGQAAIVNRKTNKIQKFIQNVYTYVFIVKSMCFWSVRSSTIGLRRKLRLKFIRNRKATIIQKFVRLYILHKRVDFDALWITSLGRSRKSIIGLEYQRSANILIQVLQAYQSMPFPTYSVICERKKRAHMLDKTLGAYVAITRARVKLLQLLLIQFLKILKLNVEYILLSKIIRKSNIHIKKLEKVIVNRQLLLQSTLLLPCIQETNTVEFMNILEKYAEQLTNYIFKRKIINYISDSTYRHVIYQKRLHVYTEFSQLESSLYVPVVVDCTDVIEYVKHNGVNPLARHLTRISGKIQLITPLDRQLLLLGRVTAYDMLDVVLSADPSNAKRAK